MKTITLANNKGGCAKTTVAFNLAVALARTGSRVLAVDLDPQGNLSAALGADLADISQTKKNSYRLMLSDSADYTQYTLDVRPRLQLIPNCLDDQGETLVEGQELNREIMLREKLEAAQSAFDYCIIDTPPRLKAPTYNGLAMADLVIIPVDASLFALIGLRELLGRIGRIRKAHQPNQQIMALMSIFTARQTLDKNVREKVLEYFTESMVFSATIPRATGVGVATATLNAITETQADSSPAAFAFYQLLREIKEVLNAEENYNQSIVSVTR